LSRVDALFDGHPGTSSSVSADATTTITFPAGTKLVDLTGWTSDDVLQRRRIALD
jgi:hypothetical protein